MFLVESHAMALLSLILKVKKRQQSNIVSRDIDETQPP